MPGLRPLIRPTSHFHAAGFQEKRSTTETNLNETLKHHHQAASLPKASVLYPETKAQATPKHQTTRSLKPIKPTPYKYTLNLDPRTIFQSLAVTGPHIKDPPNPRKTELIPTKLRDKALNPQTQPAFRDFGFRIEALGFRL